jgi:hypothetical protein
VDDAQAVRGEVVEHPERDHVEVACVQTIEGHGQGLLVGKGHAGEYHVPAEEMARRGEVRQSSFNDAYAVSQRQDTIVGH